MGYRLSKIYTRTGDDGSTSLDGKNRIQKNHQRIAVIGTLDELNCTIGLTLSQAPFDPELQTCFTQIQNDLFDIGGELSLPDRPAVTEEKVTYLEHQLDKWNETLPPLKEFILPGGCPSAAACHLARAVCRRAERELVALMQEEPVREVILHYINRLSDLLFVASRVLNRDTDHTETMWEHERK